MDRLVFRRQSCFGNERRRPTESSSYLADHKFLSAQSTAPGDLKGAGDRLTSQFLQTSWFLLFFDEPVLAAPNVPKSEFSDMCLYLFDVELFFAAPSM